MRVIAFNGSARKDGNTALLLDYVLAELRNEGIETEVVPLRGKKLRGCIACYKCFENKDRRCSVTNDDMNGCIDKMVPEKLGLVELQCFLVGFRIIFVPKPIEPQCVVNIAAMKWIQTANLPGHGHPSLPVSQQGHQKADAIEHEKGIHCTKFSDAQSLPVGSQSVIATSSAKMLKSA